MERVPSMEKKEVFDLIRALIKNLRRFQNESVFCEDITFMQFCILDHIAAAQGNLSMASLHALLGVEKSTTTRLISPLISQSLIVRGNSQRDLRAVELTLTEAGKSLHRSVWKCVDRVMEDLLGHIPEKEGKDNLMMAVSRFIEALESSCMNHRRCCRKD